MADRDWTVSGRQFRNREDYEAARKDAEYIEKLRSRYTLGRPEGAESLLHDLQAGKYRFRTILGQDFLEEVQEIAAIGAKESHASGGKGAGQKAGKVMPAGKTNKKAAVKKSTGKKRLEDYDPGTQDTIREEIRRQDRRRRLLIACCLGVAVICFGYLGIYYYQADRTNKQANSWAQLKEKKPVADDIVPVGSNGLEEDEQPPEILDEYKNLYLKNKKLIGWVKIDDTNINYPVMQTSDNEYYLTHNSNQETDKNGSIFLDKDCKVVDRSTNLIVYGHHMRSGMMFGQLNKYTSESFYEDHKYIMFDTIYEKGVYQIMYVFRSRIYEENEITFKYYQFIDANSEVEFDSYMKDMADMSLYDTGVTAQYGDKLLTLSTCDYYTDYGRFVVVARKID